MQAKIQKLLKALTGVALGVFIGRSLWLWQDVSAHPELYEVHSAPWYTQLLVEGAVTAGVILAGGAVYWILEKKRKK